MIAARRRRRALERKPMRTLPLVLCLLAACRSSGSPSNDNDMRVVSLQYAVAVEVADELNQLAAPSRYAAPETESAFMLVPDVRTNAVIVRASPADLPRVLDLIRELDREVAAKGH
jgi:type II secretory pathway component GspD/PulD (secretin)